MTRSEAYEQKRLAMWLDRQKYIWFHCPNGGERDKRIAAELKRHGVKRGVPDVIIIWPALIAIELKRTSGGKVSEEQEEWLEYFRLAGFKAAVCEGHTAAVSFIERSIEIDQTDPSGQPDAESEPSGPDE